MKSENIKNYVIGFLLGFCVVFALGVTRFVDGHCQSTLSGVGFHGEAYIAITNTSTGKTIVHRFDRSDFDVEEELTFDAESINTDQLFIYDTRRLHPKTRD